MTLSTLESEDELVIIDLSIDYPREKHTKINQGGLQGYIDNICDLAFVTNRSKSDCVECRTPNRCGWRSVSRKPRDNLYCSSVTPVSLTPTGEVPKDCSVGPGWRGELETSRGQDGTFKLNWASLVQNPRCVYGIQLVDVEANRGKMFWGTFDNFTFPIEYLNSTCHMKIRISYFHDYPKVIQSLIWEGNYTEEFRCFEVSTKVDCIEVFMDAASITMVIVTIICLAVVIVVGIMFKKQGLCQRGHRETPEEELELNDLYGTYDGIEYNTVNEDNPRYNEDGGNDDAVVTDENIYYQLETTTDHKPGDDEGNNGPTSPNGNIYYQL